MYDKQPHIDVRINGNHAFQNYENIVAEVKKKIDENNQSRTIVVIDFYPGVRTDEIFENLICKLNPIRTFEAESLIYQSSEWISKKIEDTLTDDRVFGVMSHYTLSDFVNPEALMKTQDEVANTNGVVVIYGVGASLVAQPDVLIYADLARWEIQQRYRAGASNWMIENSDEDILRKYKRGFFFEWRMVDRHKRDLFEQVDYILDTNITNLPKMITGEAFKAGMQQATGQPFRVVPFFDPGVWGGQWMKEVCDLDRNVENFAWCFDCVPEENSLLLKVGDTVVEVPSINLVFQHPKELLGDKVHARFGTEFPIRFDFLDTMEGGNLSLQVHPLTEYIQEKFGMPYTQDESYYMLDAKDDAVVYLGIANGVKKEEFVAALEKAQSGEQPFQAEKYVNEIPAKKHDHFLIPAGTVHCSGKNAMVLEVSATPYIFTFKLWDWGRVGMDGRPRPIHLEHGAKNIQFDRDLDWVNKNLHNRTVEIATGDGWREEFTGLHEREFIETRRHWFTKKVSHKTNDLVNVLNLIEGDEAIIESPENKFEPYVVHYAETFIIPAAVGEYTIRPYGKSEGKQIATLKAYVRV